MPRVPASRPRQPRWLVITLGTAAATLLGVIAALSVSVQAPALPAIAEFAPQAVEQIKAPPRQQENGASGSQAVPLPSNSTPSSSASRSSHTAAASSSSASSSSTPSPTSSSGAPIDRTRVRQCNAKTQTANPQSAPCVNYFAGSDNGGATAPGVSRDEIRVGIMTSDSSTIRVMSALVDYFNEHFQFYGRSITLVPFGGNLDLTSNDPAVENAAAAAAREQHLFAVLGPSFQTVDWSTFYDALARDHILSIPYSNELGRSTSEFVANAPYEWSFAPSTDIEEQALANWACTSLAGHPAAFGGADVASRTRRFGIVLQQTASRPVDDAALKQGLTSCRHAPNVVTVDPSTADDITVQTALARLQQAHVTSVFLLGDINLDRVALTNAAILGYHPEWLTGALGYNGANDFRLEGIEGGGNWGRPAIDQVTHMFGLLPDNRPLDYANSWWTQAVLEIDPGFSSSYESQFGDQDAAIYNAVQLLSNGIQTAGPKLTAASFERGLLGTSFPDPGAGAAPYYQAGYGFGAGDYNGVDDYAVIWWSNQAPPFNYVQGGNPESGSFCLVGNGQRFRPGSWPALSTLFNPSAGCR
jgi:hypothetical protein